MCPLFGVFFTGSSTVFFVNIDPKVDQVLTVDAADILDELLPAQDQSLALGLKLISQPHLVLTIHRKHQEQRKRLHEVIITFLRQTQPKPTWRIIVDALNCIQLPELAKKLEAAHFSADITTAHDVEPETTDNISPSPETTDNISPSPETTDNISPSPETTDNISPSPEATDNISPSPEATDNIILSPSPETNIPPSAETTDNISPSPETTDIIIPPSAETTDMPPSPMSPSAPIISDTESYSTTTYTADDDVSCFSLSLVSGKVVNTSLCAYIIFYFKLLLIADQGEGNTDYKVHQRKFELKRRFDSLTNNIRECLEIHADQVTYALISLTLDEEGHHRLFTKKNKSDLFNAANISAQLRTIKSRWNYLDPSLLEHLLEHLTMLNLTEVKDELEAYKSDLQEFRMLTTLTMFCQTQRVRHIKPPRNFLNIVAHFEWRENTTLEEVEEFRREYAHHYNLYKYAMMLYRPGSVSVTWLIPKSIEEKLKKNVPKDIFEKYFITKMEIAATCIYEAQEVNVPRCGSFTC